MDVTRGDLSPLAKVIFPQTLCRDDFDWKYKNKNEKKY